MKTIQERFQKHEDISLDAFKTITPERRFSNRPDMHALMLLDKLLPGDSDIISCSSSSMLYLDIDLEALNPVIHDDQIMELCACGVFMDEEYDCLAMFT